MEYNIQPEVPHSSSLHDAPLGAQLSSILASACGQYYTNGAGTYFFRAKGETIQEAKIPKPVKGWSIVVNTKFRNKRNAPEAYEHVIELSDGDGDDRYCPSPSSLKNTCLIVYFFK